MVHTLSTIAGCDGTFLALAPMDGVTDAITRALLTAENRDVEGRSAVSFCASEFVRVTREPASEKVLLRDIPELRGDGCTPDGIPVFVQLLGGDVQPMAESARRAAALGARGIDINFGCPAKTVNRHDGGATLLKYPERMTAITAAMREALPDSVPLSVKIRTGWDSPDHVEELARAAEHGGAAFLTIHGRTRMDMYKPKANYEAIRKAQAAVAIPVVANGDVLSPDSAQRCQRETTCDALMIGRGAMAHPNLFCQIRYGAAPYSATQFAQFLMRYLDAMAAAGVPDHRTLGRIKNWVCLGSKVCADVAPYFERIKRSPSLHDAVVAISDLDRQAAYAPAHV